MQFNGLSPYESLKLNLPEQNGIEMISGAGAFLHLLYDAGF
jgi:hypothetical protein